ncbi:MAG TPA: histidine kinase [Usitatibacter sp.]|nr:histidine kinase [Usitatibacter sp.]
MDVPEEFPALSRRLDAWAARHMGPEELEEARGIGRSFRSHGGRWLGIAAAVLVLSALLLHAIEPRLQIAQGVVFSLVAYSLLVLVTVPPYFGFRKLGGKPWRAAGLLAALALAGGAAGFLIVLLEPGRSWGDLPERARPVALAVAASFAVFVVGATLAIARLRLHDADRRNARLAEENERERRARQAVQAELKLLQAQVEPHFLFNTLANLRHLVQSGSADALPMLDHLIHYLRTALPDIRSESTTLGREAELARAYLEIMRIRMGELTFAIDVPADLSNREFPPLILMTLVENAVKHGVTPVGRGAIRVCARRAGEAIEVSVIDDGRGLGGTLGQGVGLTNVRERLNALYGARARLVLESSPDGATVARLELPG